MSADKVDVYDSKKWVRDMMGKPKSWLVDYLRNTLRSSAPSASTNNARDEICASCRLEILYKHEKVFHSSEFRFCPWCGRKLSPVA